MAKRPTINTLANTASPTYLTQLNQNFTNVQTQFDNTLSLDGSTPNAMNADIDLNGNDLINAGSVNTATLRIGGQVVNPSETVVVDSVAVKKEFETVALLLADTGTYTNYAADDYFRVVNGGFTYQVAASGASDQHVTTAGGVKLYVIAAVSGFSVKAFGAIGDGSVDDTTAIRSAINAAGRLQVTPPQITSIGGQTVNLPPGRYKVTDTLYYPSSVTFKGVGWGSSIEFAPTSAKNLFEPDATKLGSGVTIHGASFEDFTAIAMNANATDGIRDRSGTAAYAEFISVRRVVVKGFAGNGIYIGQNVSASGSTYFNVVEQCYLRENYINLYIDYWGGPTVVTGGYMLPSVTSPYQMKVYASGVTVNGVSMDGQPTAGHIYSIFPLSITGVRREQASNANTIPFLEQDYINTTDYSFYGETALNGNWLGQRGTVLKVNNYLSTSEDASNTNASGKYGIKAAFGTPTSAGDLIPNGNIRRGLYGFTQFGTGSTMAYTTAEKFLGTGSISLTVSGAHTLSSIKKTILGADLAPYVGSRLWFTCLVKANTTSYFMRLAGAGVTNPTSQSYADATAVFGDWRLHQASIQIRSASDLAIEVFSQATGIGDAIYLGGMCAYFNGFSAMPEVQPDVLFKDTAAPTTGTWLRGDVVMNSTPSAGGTPGWVCVTAGSPGTWKAMANVAV